MDEHRLSRAVLHDGEVQGNVVAKCGFHLCVRQGNQAADGEDKQQEGDSRQLQLDAVSVKHQDSPSNL